jgi:hypothetical protein
LRSNVQYHSILPFDLYELIYIILYILFIHVLTLFFFLFSNNSVNNDSDSADKDEEKIRMIATKERMTSITGNQLGHLFVTVLKIMKNVPHVHVVMNHNPQEESMAINFTGLLSHLAFFILSPGSFQ